MTKPVTRKMAVDCILDAIIGAGKVLNCRLCQSGLLPGQDIQFDHAEIADTAVEPIVSETPQELAVALSGVTDLMRDHTKDRRPFASLPLSQQAALRCQDKDFIEFSQVMQRMRGEAYLPAEDGTAAWVQKYCRVDSRSELSASNESGRVWKHLEEQYQAWRTDRQYADSRR